MAFGGCHGKGRHARTLHCKPPRSFSGVLGCIVVSAEKIDVSVMNSMFEGVAIADQTTVLRLSDVIIENFGVWFC